MHLGNNQSKKDLTAIAIGFLLIAFVIATIFLKSYFLKSKNKTVAINNNAIDQNQNVDNYKGIKVSDLAKKINTKRPLVIIDIRNKADFKTGHIVSSQNLSLASLKSKLASLDKQQQYIFVDNLGLTPLEIQALKLSSQSGFKKIAYLEGGLTEWKNQLEPVISYGNPYSLNDQSKVNYINSDDLKKLISQNNNSLYIIDLRTASEFKQGHIKGAVNIYLDDLENRYREIPLDKRIILYDANGLWAFQGAVRLFDMRILNVSALSDGFNTWKQKGFEITQADKK